MSTTSTDAHHVIGSLQDAAEELYDELVTTGSSVMLSDVVKIMIVNTKKYAGWSGELQHCPKDDASCVKPLLTITENTVLGVDDWLILEPVVRAHCDLVQARRMEGAQNLGVQPAGMSSSEALQYYKESLEVMKREAFQCQPFSVEIPTSCRESVYDFGYNYGCDRPTSSPENKPIPDGNTSALLKELAANINELSIKVGNVGAGVSISAATENLITKNPDGLYAKVKQPSDTLGYASALDEALNKKD